MCCQIATLLFGILALVNGEFSVTRNRVVSGTAARIIGGILLLPYPMSFGLVMLFWLILVTQGQGDDIDAEHMMAGVNTLSALALVLCLVSAIGIAIFTAKPKTPPNPFKLDHDHDFQPRSERDPPEEHDDHGEPPGPSDPDPRFRTR
jgi:hypothetical protein